MTIAAVKGYVLRQIRSWSLAHYLFEAFLTALLIYIATLFRQMAWYEILVLALLLFGTIASGVSLFTRRNEPELNWQFVMNYYRAMQATARAYAFTKMTTMLTYYAERVPSDIVQPNHQEEFKRWRSMVRSFLKGTCRKEIVVEFDSRSRSAEDPVSASTYLCALAIGLTDKDLRSRPQRVAAKTPAEPAA